MRTRTLAALLCTTALLWPGLAFSQATIGNLPSFSTDTTGQHVGDSGVPAARVVLGPSSTPASGGIACYNGTSATLLKDCSVVNDGAILSGALPPLVSTSNSTSVTAALIKQNITGSVQRDVNQSTVYLAPGTTTAIADANAYSAYVRSDVAGGAGANGVGFKSMSVCNQTNNCAVWGGNSIITDSLVNSIVTGATGEVLVGWEFDFGVSSPNTNVAGMSFQLQGSISQPAGADAVACAPNIAGNIHWTNCLVSVNGATTSGGAAIYIGAQAFSGTNILSQNVKYSYFDAAGVGRIYTTGISGGQAFYIQTSAGAGLASLLIDGNIQMPQTGQYVMGVDSIIGSVGAGSVNFGNGVTLTSVAIGNASASVSLTGSGVKMPNLTTVAAGTGKRFLCIDSATKQIYEGTGVSCN